MHLQTLGIVAAITAASSAMAGVIMNGDIVVERVGGTSAGGAGTSALSSAAADVYLDVYRNINGTWSRNTTITLPGTGTGAKLTASGSATSEGFINFSLNKQSITVFGYNVASGTASAKSATDRTLATVNLDTGAISTKTGAWGAGATNARSAVYTGNGFYFTNDAAVSWVADSASTATTITSGSPRVVGSDGTNLYASTGSGTARGVGQYGSGLPTSAVAAVTPLINTGGSGSVYGFAMLDTDGNGAADLAYTADSSAGLTKYVLSGGTWTSKGTIATAISGLSAYLNGNSVVISATSATGATLYAFTDGSLTGNLTGSLSSIATAATNTAFRGVVAVPAPGAAALVGLAGLITSRRRKD